MAREIGAMVARRALRQSSAMATLHSSTTLSAFSFGSNGSLLPPERSNGNWKQAHMVVDRKTALSILTVPASALF
jgi:hypothetical protein